jgi:condensin complex subunit 1
MESPVFRKLLEMVEHPCRAKEWFALAEQATNTVYALGDHPDEFCDTLIKDLTRRAFTPRASAQKLESSEKDSDAIDEDALEGADQSMAPESSATETTKDCGDAFELSQLLFVVGHVAIKHIVYLELVEREWKRQKDEKAAGKLGFHRQ